MLLLRKPAVPMFPGSSEDGFLYEAARDSRGPARHISADAVWQA